jgi:hypothetical protein
VRRKIVSFQKWKSSVQPTKEKVSMHGKFENVPFDEYLSWDAVSSTRLSRMAKSPAHYQAGFGEPTEAMLL